MTQDEIIEMAREAGIYHAQDSEYQWDGLTDQQIIKRTPDSAKDTEWRNRRTFEILERFANLVAAKEREAFAKLVAEKEREACLKIAESKRHAPIFQLTSMPPQNGTAVDIANLIRERGKA